MWELLRRFSTLENDARRLFARAALLIPLVSISLKLRGFRRTHAILQKILSRHSSTRSAITVAMTARMVRAAARYSPMRATCLEQSLVLWFLLRRHGFAPELRIGARKLAGEFQAHAWVECCGEALNEVPQLHRHYAAFDQALSSVTEAL